MRNVLLAILGLMVLPGLAFSQPDDCPECTLGIWDTTDLMQNFGTFAGPPTQATKDIFLGIKYGDSGFNGLTVVEFSVVGLDGFIVTTEAFANPTVVLGTPAAPADTTTGSGGMNIAWGSCVSGDRPLLKMTLIAFGPVGDDVVLTVVRKFPPSNPTNSFPLFAQCDSPNFTIAKVTGGCYVINPTVGPGEFVDGCQILGDAVEDRAWSTVKGLYRE